MKILGVHFSICQMMQVLPLVVAANHARAAPAVRRILTRCKPFISLNVIAALGHFINFLIAVFSSTSNGQENNTQLRYIYAQWGLKEKYCNKTCPNKFYAVNTSMVSDIQR